MKTARNVLIVLLLYATFAVTAASLVSRLATGLANAQIPSHVLSNRELRAAPVVVAITSIDPDDPFTIPCETTRDRISTDVLAVRTNDDVEWVEQELGCRPVRSA